MARLYKARNGRIQRRTPEGRFRKTTMADFGLKVWICEDCRACNPVGVGEDKPEKCHHCGSENLR